jgi:hypothetical protein
MYRQNPAILTYVSSTSQRSRPSGGMAHRICEERCEALQPPEDGDVIDLDTALGEEFLNVRYERL